MAGAWLRWWLGSPWVVLALVLLLGLCVIRWMMQVYGFEVIGSLETLDILRRAVNLIVVFLAASTLFLPNIDTRAVPYATWRHHWTRRRLPIFSQLILVPLSLWFGGKWTDGMVLWGFAILFSMVRYPVLPLIAMVLIGSASVYKLPAELLFVPIFLFAIVAPSVVHSMQQSPESKLAAISWPILGSLRVQRASAECGGALVMGLIFGLILHLPWFSDVGLGVLMSGAFSYMVGIVRVVKAMDMPWAPDHRRQHLLRDVAVLVVQWVAYFVLGLIVVELAYAWLFSAPLEIWPYLRGLVVLPWVLIALCALYLVFSYERLIDYLLGFGLFACWGVAIVLLDQEDTVDDWVVLVALLWCCATVVFSHQRLVTTGRARHWAR
ncbi:MAG: hypothetical protein HWE20_07250 [Gammaproteobacteria bacterium]|nr:hypothetical protein [Gammaproteobacteria bacterium]